MKRVKIKKRKTRRDWPKKIERRTGHIIERHHVIDTGRNLNGLLFPPDYGEPSRYDIATKRAQKLKRSGDKGAKMVPSYRCKCCLGVGSRKQFEKSGQCRPQHRNF